MRLDKTPRFALVSLWLAACVPAPALAQAAEGETPAASSARWGLGLGVGVKRKPYTGVGSETSAIPVLSFENEHVRLFGPTLDVKLGGFDGFSFTARAKVDIGGGYEASDSAALAGMSERKGSAWLGGTAAWKSGDLKLSLEALADVSGHSKGRQLKLGLEHDFRAGRFQLTPHAAGTARDAKYVDYHFGVRPDEATSTRPSYSGRRTTDAELGLRVAYPLAPRQTILLDVGAEFLGSAVKDSPIVERSTLPSARLVYVYRF